MPDEADETLDARGLSCPEPIIRLAAHMKELSCGRTLKLLADDPGAKEDIPAWCRRTQNPLVSIEEKEGMIVAIIRKK